jgi:hypothetical protein
VFGVQCPENGARGEDVASQPLTNATTNPQFPQRAPGVRNAMPMRAVDFKQVVILTRIEYLQGQMGSQVDVF